MKRHTDEPVVVALVGGSHATEDGQLDRALESGATRLLVDLDETEQMSTPGLNALLEARGRLLPEGGKIALVVPDRFERLLELMTFDRRFLCAHDRLGALQLLGIARAPDVREPTRRAA